MKDATATSIYGARASNGVIVITTKKGSNNQKLTFDYDSFISFRGRPDIGYIPSLNSEQFIQAAQDIFDPVVFPYSQVSIYQNMGSIAVAPHEQILYDLNAGLIDQSTANSQLAALASHNNLDDIKNLWFNQGILTNHTLSLSGGSNRHAFYASAAYTGEQGVSIGDMNRTFKININQDFKVHDRVTFSLITDLTQRNFNGLRPIDINSRVYPYMRFQDENGNNLDVNYMQSFSRDRFAQLETALGSSMVYNPLNDLNEGFRTNQNFQARNIFGANVQLLKNLRFEGTYSYLIGNGQSVRYDAPSSYKVRLENAQFAQAGPQPGQPRYFLPTEGGHYFEENILQRDWVVRNQLNYRNTWDNNTHSLNILVGQEAQERLIDATSSFARGYNTLLLNAPVIDLFTLSSTGITNPLVPNNIGRSVLTTAGANSPFRGTQVIERVSSYYSNANYGYQSKYFFNASLRFDQSNLFGTDRSAQNRPVWSLGGKWIAGKEGFLSGANWINQLALRSTYGLTGNPPRPGTASSFDILATRSSAFFPNGQGLIVNSPGNTLLTWESTRTFNQGIDLSFRNNSVNLSLDVYNKLTSNLIGLLPVNPFTGYNNITGNFGDMRNNGVELSLKTLNINKADFNWMSILNLAYNKNTITNLNTTVPIVTGQELINQRFVEGLPAFTVFAYDFAGLDELGDPLVQLANGDITKQRNVVMAEDMKYMGTYLPKWTGGFMNSVTYKSFRLDANMIFSFGAVMRRDGLSAIDFSGRILTARGPENFNSGNIHPDFMNRWTESNQDTNIPSYISTPALNSSRRDVRYFTQGDLNVLSADFIKLRDVTLSYQLAPALTDRLRAQEISFRLQVSNILLWTANDRGIDPEFHDPFFGTMRTPFNQGGITGGLHVTF